MKEIGVTGDVQQAQPGPRITRFRVLLPDVNDLDRLEKGLDKLAFSLGLGDQGIFTAKTTESKVIGLDIPRSPETWELVEGHLLREWAASYQGSALLPVWPGVDVLGEPFCFDLGEAPHVLVGGTTGSGKSVCLHALILSLLSRHTPDRLGFCLIDPKRVEFESYEGLPGLLGGGVVNEPEDALDALNGLVETMDQRTRVLAERGVRDLPELNARGDTDMAPILVFVEELGDLLMQSPAAEAPLIRLAQKARATGIHLVLATQRPDAATFSGQLRSNIPCRIALMVQKASESRIILDKTGAERLTGKGDMLVRTADGELTRGNRSNPTVLPELPLAP